MTAKFHFLSTFWFIMADISFHNTAVTEI